MTPPTIKFCFKTYPELDSELQEFKLRIPKTDLTNVIQLNQVIEFIRYLSQRQVEQAPYLLNTFQTQGDDYELSFIRRFPVTSSFYTNGWTPGTLNHDISIFSQSLGFHDIYNGLLVWSLTNFINGVTINFTAKGVEAYISKTVIIHTHLDPIISKTSRTFIGIIVVGVIGWLLLR